MADEIEEAESVVDEANCRSFRLVPLTFRFAPRRCPSVVHESPACLNELHKACLRGDYEYAAGLVSLPGKLYDVNERVPYDAPVIGGYPPLLLAAAANHDRIVKLLLDNGADCNARTPTGITALHLAAETRQKQVPEPQHNHGLVRVVKDFVAGLLEPRMRVNSPLVHTSVTNPTYHMTIRRLLAKGMDINVRDGWGYTPLHRVCGLYTSPSLIRLLIHSGAEVNGRCYEGSTPLHVAVEADLRRTVRLLLRYGAELEARTDKHNLTPLHIATIHGQRRMARLLLNSGADLEAKTADGFLPIHLAALADKKNKITYLLPRGAPINDPAGQDDWTPLHLACIHANDNVAQCLLRAGADVHRRCRKGYTPLHSLVLADHESLGYPRYVAHNCIDYMMRCNLEIDIRDSTGRSALHHACRLGSADVARTLLDWNANMFARDRDGHMPLDLCTAGNRGKFHALFWPYVEKLRLLLERPVGGGLWPEMGCKSFAENARRDIAAMDSHKFGESGFSLLDVAVRQPREVACRVSFKQLRMIEWFVFVDGKTQYPVYYTRLGHRVQLVVEELKKFDLVKRAYEALNELTGAHLAEDVACKIFDYVKAQDLENIIAASENDFVGCIKRVINRKSDPNRSTGAKRFEPPQGRFTWHNIDDDFDAFCRSANDCCL